ncbi:MAG: phosphoglycerate dehydrogenase [Pelolinea sp.]|nr:phosphoglycerate dehydrogenase [Pelolinea sp.]
MNRYTILLSAPYMLSYTDRFIPILEQLGFSVIIPDVNERLSEDEILNYAGAFDGTICGDDRYTSKVIKQCAPRLKVISKWGTGIDSIDKNTADELRIPVFRTTNAFTIPVSDSVLAYILAFARKQPWLDRNVKSGGWEKFPGKSLMESALGVIGVGYIGKEVLRKARAFNMRLLANDIIPIPQDLVDDLEIEVVNLEVLLKQVDFVSINCDLNPTSKHLINAEMLSLMKPTAVIINTARGLIVDERALIESLEGNKIGGAALDVFEIEPLPKTSPLLSMDQVMLAPHNSNSSPKAWEAVHWNTIRNLLIGLEMPLDKFGQVKKENTGVSD